MNQESGTFVVVAASLKSNALGRAATLATVAPGGVAGLEVWGPATTRIWNGAGSEFAPVSFTRRDIGRMSRRLNEEARAGLSPTVWISKCFPTAWSLVRRLDRRVLVIADFDDHDVALAREFTGRSLPNRIKLNPLREGSAWRVQRSQQALARRADLITTSSYALAAELGLPSSAVRIPHARPKIVVDRRAAADHIRLGFLGTMRPHKGLIEIVAALRADSRLTVTTFRQRGAEPPNDLKERWHEIDPRTPLGVAYSSVDVAVLPMATSTLGARMQLPAKAIDAAASGTPIAASPTPVLREYFGDHFLQVDDWRELGPLLWKSRADGRLLDQSRSVEALWANALSIEAVSRQLSDALAVLRSTRS